MTQSKKNTRKVKIWNLIWNFLKTKNPNFLKSRALGLVFVTSSRFKLETS